MNIKKIRKYLNESDSSLIEKIQKEISYTYGGNENDWEYKGNIDGKFYRFINKTIGIIIEIEDIDKFLGYYNNL